MSKILIIDDKQDNLVSIKAILQSLAPEHEIITALSGADGLEKANSVLPDTIILDVHMPSMDGYEVCTRLRANYLTKQIPIIFLTAIKTTPEDRIRGLEIGGDAFLTKPIDSGELLATIKAMLRIKRAEDSKHRQYEHIVSCSTDMLAMLDRDFIYLTVNNAYAKAFQVSIDELIGKTPSDVFGEEFFKNSILPHAKQCLNGNPVKYESTFDFPALGKRTMEINYFPYSEDSGSVSGFVVNGRDITDQKVAHVEMLESRSTLLSAEKIAKIGSWKLDPKTFEVSGSDEMFRIFGIESNTKADFERGNNLIHPDDKERALNISQKAINAKKPYELKYRIIREDGEERIIRTIGKPTFDEKGELLDYTGIVHDVTEENVAKETVSFQASLLNQVKNAVITIDFDNTILSWNDYAETLYQWSADEVIGKNIIDLLSAEEVKEDVLQNFKSLNREGHWEGVFNVLRKDGTTIPAHITNTYLKDGDGSNIGFIGVSYDISDRLKSEKEIISKTNSLTKAKETAEKNERKYKSLFSNMMSAFGIHEMIFDDDGEPIDYIFLEVNPVWEDVVGLRANDVLGKGIKEIMPDIEQSWLDKYGRIVSTGIPEEFVDYNAATNKYYNVFAYRHEGNQFAVVFNDVTEKMLAEEELIKAKNLAEENEERFDLAIKASSDGLYDWNLEDNSIYYSPTWKKMLGYEDDELANDFSVWESTTDPEDVKRSWALQQKLISKEVDRFELEFKMKHKDGHWVDILSRAEAVFNSDGKAIRIVGTHTDISLRKEMENQLKNNQNLLDETGQMAKIGGWEIDIASFEGSFTSGTYAIYGLPPDGPPPAVEDGIKFYAEESREIIKSAVSEAIENHTPYDLEVPFINAQGENLWVRTLCKVEVVDGKAVRLYGAIQDITDRKLHETALKESLEINQSITQTAPDAIISINPHGHILSWNHAAELMFGYLEDEILNQPMESIIPQKHLAAHNKGLDRLQHGGEPSRMGQVIELTALRKDGAEFPIELALSMWKSNNERHFTGIIRDISKRKEAERQKQEALEIAEHANSVKDEFIANISHEIRTPLNSIIGFSDLFRQRYSDKVRDTDQNIFQFIANSSKRLMGTVDSILNMSQLDAGSIVADKVNYDLNYLTRAVVGELIPFAVEKGLELKFVPTPEKAIVYVDNYCIQQAIENIVENAIKYTHKGSIDIKLVELKSSFRLSIRDTGIGISEDQHERIFLPYTQESEGFTKSYQGIGLGLALTKRYLMLNDVDLRLKSKPGAGSTFTLYFPKSKEKAQ